MGGSLPFQGWLAGVGTTRNAKRLTAIGWMGDGPLIHPSEIEIRTDGGPGHSTGTAAGGEEIQCFAAAYRALSHCPPSTGPGKWGTPHTSTPAAFCLLFHCVRRCASAQNFRVTDPKQSKLKSTPKILFFFPSLSLPFPPPLNHPYNPSRALHWLPFSHTTTNSTLFTSFFSFSFHYSLFLAFFQLAFARRQGSGFAPTWATNPLQHAIIHRRLPQAFSGCQNFNSPCALEAIRHNFHCSKLQCRCHR